MKLLTSDELDIWNEGYGAGWADRAKLVRPKRSRSRDGWVIVAGMVVGIMLAVLFGCAPAPMLAAQPCIVVVDTVTVTGAGGQRIGLERRRCP